MTIWIQRFPLNPAARFYFILFAFMHFKEGGVKIYFMIQMSLFMYCFGTIHILFMGPTATLFRKKNIKNRSHGTIHTFKNYFAIVFSVFSFSNNKFNPNRPKCYIYNFLTILLQQIF